MCLNVTLFFACDGIVTLLCACYSIVTQCDGMRLTVPLHSEPPGTQKVRRGSFHVIRPEVVNSL